jgi:hypothetical protein
MEQQQNIVELLEKLSNRESSDTVFNPYRDPKVLNNLLKYIIYLIGHQSSVMLVGESPGYDGCRWTGIPFTSGFVVRNSNHLMFRIIGKDIFLEKVVKEPTGTIMWEYLEKDKPVPILWNSFPFHPHDKGKTESNRKPTSLEVQEGVEYLKMIYDIFKPKTICCLGRVGEGTLRKNFPMSDIQYIRHPSRGGKNGFIMGMNSLKEI